MLAVFVSMSLMFSGTASASLLSNVLNTVTIPQGLTQLTQGVQGLLTGAQTSIGTAQATVQGFSATLDPTIAGQITSLQTQAQHLAADAAALDPTAAQADLTAAVAAIQGGATGVLGSLSGVALTQALTNGLTIAQQVVSPICSILGSPAALTSGVGLDLTRLYPLAAPIAVVDQTTNNLLTNIWSSLYDAITATVPAQLATLPAPVGSTASIAGALLTLLKYNWTSTYYPPNGGTPIVKTTKALLDVPTPIDVDNSGSYDLCGTTTLALDANSGKLKVVQQITKLPLAKADLPVDISGALLGVIGFGYETHDSTAPINFTSSVTLPGTNGNLIDVDNTYSVHRGWTLTLPPLLNNFVITPLPFGLGSASLPNIPALTQPAPKPKITDVISIGGSALQLRFRHEDEPNITHDGVSITGGLHYNYTGLANSDLAQFKTAIGTLGLGMGTSSPAGTAFQGDVCGLLGGAGACSTEAPADQAGESNSLKFTSNVSTNYDLFETLLGGDGTTCPTGTVSPGMDAHLTGTQFSYGQTKASTTASSGKVYIDSGGQPIQGCVSNGTATQNGLVANLPAGSVANKRVVRYHETTTFGFPTGFAPDSKAGSITCPTGTTMATPSSIILQYDLVPTVCPFPPANTVAPTITGQAVIDATLTANKGTWTPGAPNAPSFTYQWQRCDTAGANCVNISGATNSTYFLDYGDGVSGGPNSDLGHTIRVVVTGTNLDGSASATSAQTPVIVLPPPPVNTAKPVVSAVTPPPGVGRQLKTTNGTWQNGVLTFHYTWLRCDEDGSNCAAIPGANDASTYTPVLADEGHQVSVTVTAVNHGGSASATAASGQFIPPPPVNQTAPFIKDGASVATGQNVLTADSLTANNGTWKYATSFSYQWLRCDAGGASCSPISGATTGAYTVSNDDIGSTIRVAVTASNVDGSTSVTTAATGVVLLNDLAIRPATTAPDGTVNAIASDGAGGTYLGGSFDTVGKPTGGSGVVPMTTAALPANPDGTTSVALASLTQGGTVKSVSPDSSGGYFIGGSFTKVLGQPCPGVAHINGGGTLDPAYCQAGLTGDVRAVDAGYAAAGPALVAIGGNFALNGHNNLAFIKSDGTAVFNNDGDPNAPVNTIADDHQADTATSSFFIGGEFTAVGASAKKFLSKITVTAGVPANATWPIGIDRCPGTAVGSGTPCTTTVGATVKTIMFFQIKLLGGAIPSVAIGGSFDRVINGTSPSARNNAVAVGATGSPSVGSWNPNLDGQVNAIGSPAPIGANNGNVPIYLAGDFTKFGSTVIGHAGQFAINALGGGGSSGTTINSGPTNNWKPALDNGTANSISFDGTTATANVYIGGSFTSVNGVTRHRLAAFKAAGTGAVAGSEAWDPNAGRTVNSIARLSTGSLVAGGAFNVLGGVTRNNAAQVNPNSSSVSGWNPNTNGAVNAVAVSGGNVDLGGSFTTVGGQPRANLAQVDASGALTAWNPGADGPVNALLAGSGGSVIAGGSFANAGGQPRANIAQIDGPGAATGWNPGADGAVRALAAGSSAVFAGGSFTAIGGAAHGHVAGIDPVTGNATAFQSDTDGPVNAIGVSGGQVYFGGLFASVNGSARSNAAAADETTGAVSSDWTPDPDGAVNALMPFGSTVFVGGSFSNIGGATRLNAAQVDNGTGTAKSFAPDPDGSVNALSFTSGGSTVIGGSFTSAAGVLAPGVAFFGGS